MNKALVSLAVAAVTAASITGLVAPEGSAEAATRTHPRMHTLKIKITGLDGGGKQTKSGSGFVAASRVTTLDDEFLGYEVDAGSFGTSGITDRFAIALDGGILYCTTTSTQTNENEKGYVTGGVGKFAGAKGTVVSGSSDQEAQTATYTIRWHT